MTKESNKKPARILIADDNEDILEALRLLLKSSGHSVVRATSPAGVEAAAAAEPLDLALIDMNYARDTTSGEEGLDELSIAGPSRIAALGLPALADRVVPEDAGLARRPLDELRGGDPAYNAAALRRLLQGAAGAYRDAVLLNTAGALLVAGEVRDWHEGVEEAAEAIDKGLANALLDCWISACK